MSQGPLMATKYLWPLRAVATINRSDIISLHAR
jgi:hypothetical protein